MITDLCKLDLKVLNLSLYLSAMIHMVARYAE